MINDILIRMIGIFLSRSFIFITSLFVARLVTEEDWGHIGLIMSYFSLLFVLSGNIITRAIVTFTAQSRNPTKSTDIILFMGNRLNLSIAMIVLILSYVVLQLFSPISDKIAERTLLVIMPCIIAVILSQNIISYFQGLGEVTHMTILEVLRGMVQSLILIISVNLLIGPLNGWMLGRVLGIISVFLLFMAILWFKYRIHLLHWSIEDLAIYNKMKIYLKWAYISALLSLGIRGLDVIIISEYYNDATLTGTFKLSIMIFAAFGLFGQSITSALYHRFAQLESKSEMLYRLSLRIKLFAVPLYSCIAIIMLLFSHELLSLFFSRKYELLHDVIGVIIIASIFQNYTYINGAIWSAIGDMKLNTKFYSVYSIAYFIFMMYTVMQYEFIMFPYALLAITILGAIYSEILLRKRLLL